jgi:protein phosphatase
MPCAWNVARFGQIGARNAGRSTSSGTFTAVPPSLRCFLERLGYKIFWDNGSGDRQARVESPEGRKLVFVGDLVDRGPRSPDVLRIAMASVESGVGYVVQGNHDNKLQRWLDGRDVKIGHGLQESIDQLGQEADTFKAKAKAFLYELRSHYWLDAGRLTVVHAGLKEEMIGRGSPAVRDFALYGETNGEVDEYGLPVRADWAAGYRGKTTVVYGHTPVPEAEWVNNTICIDTGCVFGGKLTALRWPKKELVSVPAAATYFEPVRPLARTAYESSAQNAADDLLDYSDVAGRRWIDTGLMKRIVVAEENAAAALEAVSCFAIAPQWLIYLPPTMSPVETSKEDGWLERPEEAFTFFRERGESEVILQEKHMGSRAVIAICRNRDVARARFGIMTGEAGAIWTRTGRAFFGNHTMAKAVLDWVCAALDAIDLWEELATDWFLIDAEIMPWSAKASSLIERQYTPVAAASQAGLGAALSAAERAAARGIPVDALRDRLADRAERALKYADTWAPYTWTVAGVDDLRIAPFHILASEGAVHFDKSHRWHMNVAERIAAAGTPLVVTTWQQLPIGDADACAKAISWWEEITARGGEGMVVKPSMFIARGSKGLIQPALKVRGREYLRMIYGPEYDAPDNLSRLRERGLGGKRALALKEFALGPEALTRFVAREPLRRIHECVFAVLALESEPIDPRL